MLISRALLAVGLGGAALSGTAHAQLRNEQQLLQDSAPIKSRLNKVFILTDDQDLHINSLAYMPRLQKHLLDEGAFSKDTIAQSRFAVHHV